MTGPQYHYLVEVDGASETRRRYDGTDAADAMAAWSAAILDGVEYVTLEAITATQPQPEGGAS